MIRLICGDETCVTRIASNRLGLPTAVTSVQNVAAELSLTSSGSVGPKLGLMVLEACRRPAIWDVRPLKGMTAFRMTSCSRMPAFVSVWKCSPHWRPRSYTGERENADRSCRVK